MFAKTIAKNGNKKRVSESAGEGASSDQPSSAPTTTQKQVVTCEDSATNGDGGEVKFAARTIICRTTDGDDFSVAYYLLTQSKLFLEQWNEAKAKKKRGNRKKKFVFRLPECVDGDLFQDVITWMEQHDGI
jgi:hypothetical protein